MHAERHAGITSASHSEDARGRAGLGCLGRRRRHTDLIGRSHPDNHRVRCRVTVVVGHFERQRVYADRQPDCRRFARSNRRTALTPYITRDGAVAVGRTAAVEGDQLSAVAVAVGHGLIWSGVGVWRKIRQSIADGVVEIEAAVNRPGVEPDGRCAAAIGAVQKNIDHLAVTGHVAAGPDQRCRTSDVRRRHRRPGIPGVAPGVTWRGGAATLRHRVSGQDDVAGGRDVHPGPVVGERRAPMVFVERGDRDDVIEGGGVEGGRRAIVARAGDDDHTRVPGILHGVVQRLGVLRLAQAHVDDVGAIGDSSRDGLLNREIVAGSVRAADLVGADARVWRHAGNPFGFGRVAGEVVEGGGNCSGHMGAVAVIVHRVAVEKHEVIAAGVVRRDVRMRIVDARVDHRYRDGGAASGDCPRLGRVYIGIGSAAVKAEFPKDKGKTVELLTSVVKSPLVLEMEVTRHNFRATMIDEDRQAPDVVRLRVLDVRVAPVAGDGTGLVTGSYPNTLDPRALDFGCLRAPSVSVSVGFRVRIGVWPELHEDFAREETPSRLRRGGSGYRDHDESGEGDEGFREVHSAILRLFANRVVWTLKRNCRGAMAGPSEVTLPPDVSRVCGSVLFRADRSAADRVPRKIVLVGAESAGFQHQCEHSTSVRCHASPFTTLAR